MGLDAVIYFRRSGSKGTITAVNQWGNEWTTTAYDRGPNTTPGADPYGTDYQLPPGEYSISPRPQHLPRAGRPTVSNTNNWNLVVTPQGTLRWGVQLHRGKGPYRSEGCIVSQDIDKIISIIETEYNKGGVTLIIEDIGPGPQPIFYP